MYKYNMVAVALLLICFCGCKKGVDDDNIDSVGPKYYNGIYLTEESTDWYWYVSYGSGIYLDKNKIRTTFDFATLSQDDREDCDMEVKEYAGQFSGSRGFRVKKVSGDTYWKVVKNGETTSYSLLLRHDAMKAEYGVDEKELDKPFLFKIHEIKKDNGETRYAIESVGFPGHYLSPVGSREVPGGFTFVQYSGPQLAPAFIIKK